MLGKLWTLKLKCLNKSLQNIFAHSMSQINWYSETSVIFTCMVTLSYGNTNTSYQSILLLCLTTILLEYHG